MADYCTLAEANALIPTQSFTTTSKPSAEQAAALVEAVAREIDGILIGNGWTLPIGVSNLLDYLRTVNIYGAAAALLRARFPEARGTGGDGGAADFLERRYSDAKRQLASKAFSPQAFVADATPFGDGFPDPLETEVETDEPFFTRGMEF